jgi:hypothetical protein
LQGHCVIACSFSRSRLSLRFKKKRVSFLSRVSCRNKSLSIVPNSCKSRLSGIMQYYQFLRLFTSPRHLNTTNTGYRFKLLYNGTSISNSFFRNFQYNFVYPPILFTASAAAPAEEAWLYPCTTPSPALIPCAITEVASIPSITTLPTFVPVWPISVRPSGRGGISVRVTVRVSVGFGGFEGQG